MTYAEWKAFEAGYLEGDERGFDAGVRVESCFTRDQRREVTRLEESQSRAVERGDEAWRRIEAATQLRPGDARCEDGSLTLVAVGYNQCLEDVKRILLHGEQDQYHMEGD